MDYTDPTFPRPPHYKIYTLLSSGETFVMFSTLWLLQIVSIWCKNCLKSPIFKRLSYFDQCLHSFYSVIIPSPSKDWSDGEGDCAQHFQRMKIVDAEVISTIKLNSLFQAAHLIPMFILGKDYFSNYLLNYVELLCISTVIQYLFIF